MKMLLALALLLFSTVAIADGVLRGPNGDMIVFKESPCTHATVLVLIKPEAHKSFKQAALRFEGRLIAACWAEAPSNPDIIFLIDADGDGGAIPRNAIEFDAEA